MSYQTVVLEGQEIIKDNVPQLRKNIQNKQLCKSIIQRLVLELLTILTFRSLLKFNDNYTICHIRRHTQQNCIMIQQRFLVSTLNLLLFQSQVK